MCKYFWLTYLTNSIIRETTANSQSRLEPVKVNEWLPKTALSATHGRVQKGCIIILTINRSSLCRYKWLYKLYYLCYCVQSCSYSNFYLAYIQCHWCTECVHVRMSCILYLKPFTCKSSIQLHCVGCVVVSFQGGRDCAKGGGECLPPPPTKWSPDDICFLPWCHYQTWAW